MGLLFFAFYNIVYLPYFGENVQRESPNHHKSVHKLEIFESGFVLFAGLLSIVCYMANIHDFVYEYSAFCKLFAFAIFMLSQYITIIYIQLNIDRIIYTTKLLTFAGGISAISIMYLFLFEYAHLVDL